MTSVVVVCLPALAASVVQAVGQSFVAWPHIFRSPFACPPFVAPVEAVGVSQPPAHPCAHVPSEGVPALGRSAFDPFCEVP
jgi:hypothetical protein